MRRGATRTARPELADRLHSAAIHLLRRARRTDPLTGVSAAQLSALSVLMSGPKTLGELATAEQVRPPTMSRLVSEMQRMGVARKVADRGDRRGVQIHATAKGLRALRRGRAMRVDAIAGLLATPSAAATPALLHALGLVQELPGAPRPPRAARRVAAR